MKTAATRNRATEHAITAAEAPGTLLHLRSPAPGRAAYLSNQVTNALNAPVGAARVELEQVEQAATATPARIRLGEAAPDMVRLDAETKQVTYAIRSAAYTPKPC